MNKSETQKYVCELREEIAKLEEKNKQLEDTNKYLGERLDVLRTRCKDSAVGMFDNNCYGCLSIVTYPRENEFEIKILKQRIAELESKETVDLPFDPLETANYLINATYERETSSLERTFAKVPDKVNSDKYTINELEQIAEHLLIYCKHNKEFEE